MLSISNRLNWEEIKCRKRENIIFQKLIQILEKETIDDEYKSYIGNNVRFMRYGEKDILILRIMGLDSPAIYDNQYYQRMGANIERIETKNIASLFAKFPQQK